MEVQLGDKIWCSYYDSVMCGYVVDHSPNGEFIATSTLTIDEYNELKKKQEPPCMWWRTCGLTLRDHLPKEKTVIRKNQALGFQF